MEKLLKYFKDLLYCIRPLKYKVLVLVLIMSNYTKISTDEFSFKIRIYGKIIFLYDIKIKIAIHITVKFEKSVRYTCKFTLKKHFVANYDVYLRLSLQSILYISNVTNVFILSLKDYSGWHYCTIL